VKHKRRVAADTKHRISSIEEHLFCVSLWTLSLVHNCSFIPHNHLPYSGIFTTLSMSPTNTASYHCLCNIKHSGTLKQSALLMKTLCFYFRLQKEKLRLLLPQPRPPHQQLQKPAVLIHLRYESKAMINEPNNHQTQYCQSFRNPLDIPIKVLWLWRVYNTETRNNVSYRLLQYWGSIQRIGIFLTKHHNTKANKGHGKDTSCILNHNSSWTCMVFIHYTEAGIRPTAFWTW
jgi:hypothetical protein